MMMSIISMFNNTVAPVQIQCLSFFPHIFEVTKSRDQEEKASQIK